jgi:hypothetical protein
MVIKMPKPFIVPAKGTLNYKFIVVKTNFPEDMWVTAAEMRPGESAVVHHGKVWMRPPGSSWMAKATPGEAYDNETNAEIMGKKTDREGGEDSDILAKFNPGLGAQDFTAEGSAKLLKKGSDLVFELHYTADGTETADVSEVGLSIQKAAPISRRYFYTSGPGAGNLVIPAGDANAEVVGETTIGIEGVHLIYMQPHMHVRGKDFEVRAVYPTGEMQTLLYAKWDFNWQEGYQLKEPLPMPKGTRLISIVHYDNSPNNPYNPDPTKEVHNGLQTWDEMSNLFVGVTLNMGDDPEKIFKRSGPSLLKPVYGVAGPTISALDLPTKGSH